MAGVFYFLGAGDVRELWNNLAMGKGRGFVKLFVRSGWIDMVPSDMT